MADCDILQAELNKLISILRGEAPNTLVEIDLQNRQEYATVKEFNLQPKASASAINAYIQDNKITADQIIDIKTTTRQDGMINVMLVWGRVNPTLVAGEQGEQGAKGDPGEKGLPGVDGQCHCDGEPEYLIDPNSPCPTFTFSIVAKWGETYTFPVAPASDSTWVLDLGGYVTIAGTGNIGTYTLGLDIFDPGDYVDHPFVINGYYSCATSDTAAPEVGTNAAKFAYVAENTVSRAQRTVFTMLARMAGIRVGEHDVLYEDVDWAAVHSWYNDDYLGYYANLTLSTSSSSSGYTQSFDYKNKPTLDLTGAGLTDLSWIATLTNLRRLNLSDNNLSTYHLMQIQNLELEELIVDNNLINSDLAFWAFNNSLKHLSFENNLVFEFNTFRDTVVGNEGGTPIVLERLNVSRNPFYSFSIIGNSAEYYEARGCLVPTGLGFTGNIAGDTWDLSAAQFSGIDNAIKVWNISDTKQTNGATFLSNNPDAVLVNTPSYGSMEPHPFSIKNFGGARYAHIHKNYMAFDYGEL